MSDFYLTLPSNSSMHHYPENSPSDFITELPKPIDLKTNNYEVGLAEIQYPNTYTNLDEGWIRLKLGNRTEEINLPSGLYDSPSTLVNVLNSCLTDFNPPNYKTECDINFSYNKSTRLATIDIKTKDCEIELSPEISDMLGMIGYCMIGPHKYVSRVMCDVHKHSNAMYVYCNIVEMRQVGDMLVPLLRILPANNKSIDVIHHLFEKPHYIPLNRYQFNNIEILLRTDTGRKPTFLSGTSVVTLHFRSRK